MDIDKSLTDLIARAQRDVANNQVMRSVAQHYVDLANARYAAKEWTNAAWAAARAQSISNGLGSDEACEAYAVVDRIGQEVHYRRLKGVLI